MLTEDGERDCVVLATVRDHNERLDGSGYPRGLLAADISVPVRIVTLCDVYAAMTEPRPYGTPLQLQEALTLMARKRLRLILVL
jgi:HD-GYP domain-containing protein (c-di-GMP phosphodiesterase class II)